MALRIRLKLKKREREALLRMRESGEVSVRVMVRGEILLLLDKGWSKEAIVEAIGTSTTRIGRVKRRYLDEGLKRALYDNPRPGRKPLFDAKARKHLVALACSQPPKDHPRWTCELLAERCGLRERPSKNTISLVLMEQGIKPWREKNVVRSHA